MITPSFHSFSKFREICWSLILGNILSNLSDVPKISPFGIKRRRIWSVCSILVCKIVYDIIMLPCFFSILRCCSNLKIFFRKNIWNWFTLIKLCWPSQKKLLHLIEKFIILLNIYSWILNDQAPIFVKCICDWFTVFSIISWLLKKVWNVNNRYNWLAKEVFNRSDWQHHLFKILINNYKLLINYAKYKKYKFKINKNKNHIFSFDYYRISIKLIKSWSKLAPIFYKFL